jgi:two-component system sensor histidine kinase BaeS
MLVGLLAATLPAILAGSPAAALAGALLASCAIAMGLAAWRLGRSSGRAPIGNDERLRLLDSVATALRDPTHTISGFAELLGNGRGKDPESAEFRNACRFIREASDDVSRFAASLQDFVRHEQGRILLIEQQVDAAELVAAALSPCRGPAERADVVIVATLLDGVELRCDPLRLKGAIGNLVLWTAAASPARSVIAVTLVRCEDDGLAVSLSTPAHVARPAADAQPFAPRIGLDGLNGLALPIARRVALLHAGDMTIDSDPITGCTVRLVLPRERVRWPAPARARISRAA